MRSLQRRKRKRREKKKLFHSSRAIPRYILNKEERQRGKGGRQDNVECVGDELEHPRGFLNFPLGDVQFLVDRHPIRPTHHTVAMSSFMQDTRDPEEDLGLLELLGEGQVALS